MIHLSQADAQPSSTLSSPATVSAADLASMEPAPLPSMSLRSNSLPDLPSSIAFFNPASPLPHDPLVSSDDTALTVLSSLTAPNAPLTSHQRQLARTALLLGLSKASSLRSSSTVLRFSLDTMNSLVPGPARRMAVGGWMEYGEPMLKRIDERLDEAVNAIANATSGLQHVYAYNPAASAATGTGSHMNPYQQRMEHEPPSVSSHESSASAISFDDSSSASQLLVPISATSSPTASSLYAAYWERLKSKFVSSHWYTKVDHILLQNSVVHAFTHHLLHPAEVFFATVTEEFLASQQSQEDFLASLQQRVGPAWDERLAPLAKGFYTTAKAVSAVVGAGRFVGGVMQLGKMRVDGVMEDLLKQWDRVLGLGDDMMDRYLPEVEGENDMKRLESGRMDEDEDDELEGEERMQSSKEEKHESEHVLPCERWHSRSDHSVASTEDDAASVLSAASSPYLPRPPRDEGPRLRRSGKKRSSQHLDRYEQQEHDSIQTDDSDEAEDEFELDSYNTLSSSLTLPSLPSHPDRTGQVLITKFGKRLRQRIPSSLSLHPSSSLSLASFSTDLKQRLMESSWFTLVDDILMQNALVKALAAFVRPAEHFFQTSLQLWSSQRVDDMKRLLEAAVDDSEDIAKEHAEEQADQARVEEERVGEAGMEEVEESQDGDATAAEPRNGEESSRAMQWEHSPPHSSAPLVVAAPIFSPSLFTTVNPAASFSLSPLPATHSNHTLTSHSSASQAMSATLPSSSLAAYTSAFLPATTTATQPPSLSFAAQQHLSSTASTFLPRIIPPSPASFVSTSTLSPTSSSLSADPVFDDFAFHLRERLGGSWDDRLYQPTRSFYQTAQSIRPKPTA